MMRSLDDGCTANRQHARLRKPSEHDCQLGSGELAFGGSLGSASLSCRPTFGAFGLPELVHCQGSKNCFSLYIYIYFCPFGQLSSSHFGDPLFFLLSHLQPRARSSPTPLVLRDQIGQFEFLFGSGVDGSVGLKRK